MKKIFLILFLGIFLISIASATGLTFTTNSYSINKTYGQDYFINLSIRNADNIDFYNISFENNPYISISKIDKIVPGEIKNIQARVFSNENVNNISVNLLGFYQKNIGDSNITHTINVNWEDGVDKNSFNMIKGDILKIKNNEQTRILYFKILSTGQILQIDPLTTFTKSDFNTPLTFSYSLYYYSDIFAWNGQITVEDDLDFQHRSEYDALLNLNIKTSYTQTSVITTFVETNYTTDFFNSQEGLFVIKNTGNTIAKTIKLSGEWFSFSSNNFDLESGQSKTISYIIKPVISSSNQTNQTYTKNVSIEGNFDKIVKTFNIFINYAQVNSNSSSQTGLIDFITQFCNENPSICNTEPQIIYRDSNSSENYFNATLGEKQLMDLFKLIIENADASTSLANYYKQQLENMTLSFEEVKNNSIAAKNYALEMNDKIETNNSVWIFVGLIFSLIVICGLILYLVYYYKKKQQINVEGQI